NTNEKTNHLALAQATHYTILDYFNQYTYAQVSAQAIGEIAYTETMTFWSTAISAPAILFGSWATGALEKSLQEAGKELTAKVFLKELLKSTIGGALKEVYQEIVIDSFIETLIENGLSFIPWVTQDMATWASSFATSVRESAGELGKQASALRSGLTQKAYAQLVSTNGQSQENLSPKQRKALAEKATNIAVAQMEYKQDLSNKKKSLLSKFAKGLFKGVALLGSSLFFGGFGVGAVLNIGSLTSGIYKKLPDVCKKITETIQKRRQKIPSGFTVSQVFIDNLYTKKPGTISGDQINELFRDKNIDIQNLQRAPYLSPINEIMGKSMADVKSNLVDIFNSPMVEDIFLQWTNEYVLQQPDLKQINDKVQGIIANRKKIGIQEAHTQILSEIKSLKKEMISLGLPHSERFFNMWGAWIIDPHVTVLGIHKSTLNRREISDYEITERTNSIPAMVENLRQQFLSNPMGKTDFALVVQGINQRDGEVKVLQIPETVDNIIRYLNEKGIRASDANYYFVPSYNINANPDFFKGNGMFIETQTWRDSGNPSPNYDLLINFQNELSDLLNSIGFKIESERDFKEIISGLNKKGDNLKNSYSVLKSRLKNGDSFYVQEENLDIWISRIIYKIQNSEDRSQMQKSEDITKIKDLFNNYYTLFGYSPFASSDNFFHREIRFITYLASTILYDTRVPNQDGSTSPLIPSDSALQLGKAIGFWATLNSWLTGKVDLSANPQKIREFKRKILEFIENKKDDHQVEFSENNYNRICSEISYFFNEIGSLAKYTLYQDTFNYKNSGFIRLIRVILHLLDPDNKIFRSFNQFSELLFGDENYISEEATKGFKSFPAKLFASIYKSYIWKGKDFDHVKTKEEVKRLAVDYRELIKKYMFSNPKEYSPYVTKDNELRFSPDVFSRLMDLRYEVDKNIWLSSSIILKKSMIGKRDVTELFGNGIFEKLLTTSHLTKERFLEDAIDQIYYFKELANIKFLEGEISKVQFDFQLKIFDETLDSLNEYRAFINENLKDIISQFLGRSVSLSSQVKNLESGRLKSFLTNHHPIQKTIEWLAKKVIFGDQKVNRISSLGYGITSDTFHFDSNDAKELKQDFIDYLSDKDFFKSWSDNVKDSEISEVTEHLMKAVSVHRELEPNIFYKHANLELLLKDLMSEGLAAESPMFIKIAERYWTGHSDLIFRKSDTIYIADYKPNYNLEGTPAEHFVNAFPQLISYALTILSQIDKGLKVKCIVFNNEQAVEFDPIEIFTPIKEFLQGDFDQTDSRAWRDYNRDWTTKEIFKDFISDFEYVIEKLKEKGYILNN
ncbi:MAG: hypothetical protein P8Y70_06195, partial [Candidatus Lokiarchaeota archaeon]